MLQQLQDGLLHRHVEGRRRLVGHDDVGVVDERHGNHHALLLSAADLVWIAVENLLGAGEEHLFEQCYHLLPFVSRLSVRPHHLHHLLAAFLHGVQTRHRLLEDHADAFAAHLPHLLLVEREELGALQQGAARDGRLCRQQPHQRQRADTFAAAALAHDAQRLPVSQREVQILHHLVSLEGNREPLYFKYVIISIHTTITQEATKNFAI